jgi:cell division protease FtsH
MTTPAPQESIMSLKVGLPDLPQRLDATEAVALAYPEELAELAAALQRGLSCLVECAKELAPFLFLNLRERLKVQGLRCVYLDGRPAPDEKPGPLAPGMLGRLLAQLREAVRGAVEKRVIVLPHLDLLAGGPAVLSAEAREATALLLENPELLWIGFRDPSLPLPRILEELAACRIRILGVERSRLGRLVTRAEGRKFGADVDVGALHRQVSGANAVRLRRLLSTLDREDLPDNPQLALAELRRLTLAGGLTVPPETFGDIGGYADIKQRLHEDVLAVLGRIDAAESAEERARLERLLPRGLIFAGPSGTGKGLFARALANAVGAALLETSGSELKSRYVGGSEENLRQLFGRARQAAPSLILFHDIDSFAGSPGRTAGPVEPSMRMQLQQELDALPHGELVLVAGTTRDRVHLDPALLQPGRFELVLEVGAPSAEDRRDILVRFGEALDLSFSPRALAWAVDHTGEVSERPPWHGARLQALCRALARQRLREGRIDETQQPDVKRALASL